MTSVGDMILRILKPFEKLKHLLSYTAPACSQRERSQKNYETEATTISTNVLDP
jgi:hypothetical protein